MTFPHGKGVREQERVCPSVLLFVMFLATLAQNLGIWDGVPSTAYSSIYLLLFYFIHFFFQIIKRNMIYLIIYLHCAA